MMRSTVKNKGGLTCLFYFYVFIFDIFPNKAQVKVHFFNVFTFLDGECIFFFFVKKGYRTKIPILGDSVRGKILLGEILPGKILSHPTKVRKYTNWCEAPENFEGILIAI
jgi:hypothetical protein